VLRRVDLRGQGADPASVLDAAGAGADDDATTAVRDVIAAVRAGGDGALRALTARFDGVEIDDLRVPPSAAAEALAGLPRELRDSLELAAGRIRDYHEAQAAVPQPRGIDRDGVRVTEVVRPVDRAGLYVPGGRAAYPSTVLMTAIPAQVAGVPEIVLCVPPDRTGAVPAVTLAAAALVGLDHVYRVGGAQAIAALAYGTESILPVDVIVGPGNRYVSIAKREVAGAGVVGIESPAGPSDLVVVADESTPAEPVAADLAAQAEHGPDGFSMLVTWVEEIADTVDRALDDLLANGSERADGARAALGKTGRAVLVRDAAQALDVVNLVAPEHVELAVRDPDDLLAGVRHAGAVFCGAATATALGDYVAGANHVLPTGRAARFASALRVDDFRHHLHVVHATPAGADQLGAAAAVIARAEGLDLHARSLDLRRDP